jgi:hypothetical protein
MRMSFNSLATFQIGILALADPAEANSTGVRLRRDEPLSCPSLAWSPFLPVAPESWANKPQTASKKEEPTPSYFKVDPATLG